MKHIFLFTTIFTIFVFADFTRDNGIVTDNKTTLEWQDDYSDNYDSVVIVDWQEAIDYCEALTLGGKDDWRLPNKKEYLSIVDYGRADPSINPIFLNTRLHEYWSSTTQIDNSNQAWLVGFTKGYTNFDNKSGTRYARCVRG